MAKLLQAMADGFRYLSKAFGMGVIGRRHDQHGKFHAHLFP
jgi:cyanate permease